MKPSPVNFAGADSRKPLRCILRLAALLLSLAGPWASSAEEKARPNILFFLIDDQRFDQLGCYGNTIVQTPHIDRLAAQGVRFTQAFVTTPICMASRASIFTGLQSRDHRVYAYTTPMPAELQSDAYPPRLRAAGYVTGFTGKFGFKIGGRGEEPAGWFDFFRPRGRTPYFHRMPGGGWRHETDLVADDAVEFLRHCARQESGKPFCLSVSFNAVHAEDDDRRAGIGHFPWPPSADGMYDEVAMPPPRLGDPAIFEALPVFLKNSINRIRYFWDADTPEKYEVNLRAYYRLTSGMDAAVGRVVAELDRLGLRENTLIVYFADNGLLMGNRGLAGKWVHYDESVHVPLIVVDPRLPAARRGAVEGRFATNLDLPATFLSWASVQPPKTWAGRSLTPLLRGEKVADWPTAFYGDHRHPDPTVPNWEGVRTERFVYARYDVRPRAVGAAQSGGEAVYEFLHDRASDPDELKNLADDPVFADTLASMRAQCDAMRPVGRSSP